jgi:hypothetical protein
MANENYGIALGMIETRGLVPAVEAADGVSLSVVATSPSSYEVKPALSTLPSVQGQMPVNALAMDW